MRPPRWPSRVTSSGPATPSSSKRPAPSLSKASPPTWRTSARNVPSLHRGPDRHGHLGRDRPQVHRLPAPQRAWPADPRGGARRPRRQAGDAGDGRPADPPLRAPALPRALTVHAARPDRALPDRRLRGDRLPGRLRQAPPPPLARASGPLEAPVARGRHDRRRHRRPRAGPARHLDLRADRERRHSALLRLLRLPVPDHRRSRERREPHRRPRRARRRDRDHRAPHLPCDHGDRLRPLRRRRRRRSLALPARPRHPRGGADRGLDRLPLVQRLSSRGVHGRHGLDGLRRGSRRLRDRHRHRVAADPDRRHLRRRGALRDHPDGQLQVLGAPRLPDRADPPPLRDEGLVRDEDHGAVLDHRRDPLRLRLRPLLPLLLRLQAPVRRALVLGLARSGLAAKKALEAKGVEVVAADRTLGNDADPGLLDGVEVLVKSPGVPAGAPLVAAARERGIPVWSEIELAARLLPNPLVGITGTNGKTTTTELLGAMLGARTAGNVGTALSELVGEVEPEEWIVCELSSFQLEDIDELRPRIAVLLNLEPDHLDRHGDFDAYRDAKLRIFENQTEEDVAVVPRGFGPVPGVGRRVEFSAEDELPAEPLIPGGHNRENAAAATAAARAAGMDDEAIATALRTFPGVPHRLELVTELDGVRYVNDSKATNTAAARRALTAFEAPLHLILGGSLKGERFDEFAADVARANVVAAYLIGEAAEPLAADLGYASVSFLVSTTLERAVTEAAGAARPGEIVLLSPACASYDQFRDFEHRGKEFRRLVENLQG